MSRFDDSRSKDPEVNITTWFLLVVAVLCVISRLGTKLWMFHTLTSDDYLIIISLIFCVGEVIAISIATANGYGGHFATIDRMQFEAVMKFEYSAFLLFVLSLYFSKLSLSVFIRNLTPVSKDHFYAITLQTFLTVWVVVTLFGSAFSCQVPRTWDYRHGQCFNLQAWKYYFGVSNIVTDALIVIQALYLIGRIHSPLRKKVVFAVIFLSRILVIIASIVDTALTRDIAHSADPTFDGYEIILVTQVVQCLSIVTACWGQLKPFLNHLTSDGLRVQGVEGQNTRIKPCPGSYSHDGTIRSGQGNHHELVPAAVWDAGSQSSQAGMIRETREWTMADTGQDQQGN